MCLNLNSQRLVTSFGYYKCKPLQEFLKKEQRQLSFAAFIIFPDTLMNILLYYSYINYIPSDYSSWKKLHGVFRLRSQFSRLPCIL